MVTALIPLVGIAALVLVDGVRIDQRRTHDEAAGVQSRLLALAVRMEIESALRNRRAVDSDAALPVPMSGEVTIDLKVDDINGIAVADVVVRLAEVPRSCSMHFAREAGGWRLIRVGDE
jgi:hypothetical protein